MEGKLDVEGILAASTDENVWWTTLLNFMLREKLVTEAVLIQNDKRQCHKQLLELFVSKVLAGEVPHPERFLLKPWALWFEFEQVPRGTVTKARLQQLVEGGAAAFERAPEDVEALTRALTEPNAVPVTWANIRTWLYHSTDREFLLEYLRRYGVHRAEDEPKRRLWVKFKMLVTKSVTSRDDLEFLGLAQKIHPDLAQDFRLKFRVFVEHVERSIRDPYTHGPLVPTPLDRELEEGQVVELKRFGVQYASEIKRLEQHLDARYLVSWLAERTEQSEFSLRDMSKERLYGWYLYYLQCHDASEAVARTFHHEDLVPWLNEQHAFVTKEQQVDAAQLMQRFCEAERVLNEKLSHNDFSGLDLERDVLLQLARHHYHTVDPEYLSTDNLIDVANRVAYTNNPKMSRKAAQAVLNAVIEEVLTEIEFLQLARERASPPDLTASLARVFILASNTRRLLFFTAGRCTPLNLAADADALDLFRDPSLRGRELGESLMRQYATLLHLYGTCAIGPASTEQSIRAFVLKHQFL